VKELADTSSLTWTWRWTTVKTAFVIISHCMSRPLPSGSPSIYTVPKKAIVACKAPEKNLRGKTTWP